MKRKPDAAPTWTDYDTALWHTCQIAFDLVRGNSPGPAYRVLAPFPARFAPDERFWCSGGFQLLEQRASGDGSYVHDSSFFFATGAAGIIGTAAFAASRAAGNSARRTAAQAATIPRWTVVDAGQLHLSRLGFYMQSASGIFPWNYAAVSGAQMVGPRTMHFYGESERGQVSWLLVSDWAELSFLTWAITHHPQHPQLHTGGWLPPGWLHWASERGHRTHLSTPVLAR